MANYRVVIALLILETVLILLLVTEWRRRKRTCKALGESDSHLNLALETANMGAWEWNRNTNALKWSKQNYIIMGLPPVQIALNYDAWIDRVHPADLGRAMAEAQKAAAENAIYRSEYRVIRHDGSVRWIQERGKPIYDERGRCVQMIGLTIDVTDRRCSELRFEAQSKISQILSEATSVNDVTASIVRAVCECLDWALGEVWKVDDGLALMTRIESYGKSTSAVAEFDGASRYLIFSSGVGLPGCVWQKQAAMWASDLSDFNCPRTWLAIQAGLRSAFAFPIFVDHRIFSVMVFYSHEPRDPDRELLQMMESVGRQIGQFVERGRAADALHETERRNRAMLRTIPDLMFLMSKEGVFLDYHARNSDLLYVPPNQFLGKNIKEVVPTQLAATFESCFERALESGETQICEYDLEMKRGRRWYEARIVPCDATTLLSVILDVTERRQLEDDLRQARREFETLVDNSPGVISRLDPNLRFIYVSPSLQGMSGTSPELILGKTPSEARFPDCGTSDFEESCREAFAKKRTIVWKAVANGRKHRIRIIPELSPDGAVESVMSIIEDLTERLRTEQELRTLTARLFDLQDNERRRIARELHDGAAQNVFALMICLDNLQRQVAGGIGDTKGIIEDCKSLAGQSLQELRTLSFLLHPPILDRAGLVVGIRWFVDGFSKRSGIRVELNALQDIGRLPSEIETALFRIVQESLTNVHRHSGSETASVRLVRKAGELRLEISDRGRGMLQSMDPASQEIPQPGVGIPGMRQRLLHLGGRLEIESNECGTTIVAVVPAPETDYHAQEYTK
jgi:PAS domain S-box-containing protein